ncbi:cupin domain-containing protein [Streptomyces sp. HUCO-GS316]|uniref:cupin domain-containing protein n=1 Tax=Streptomyces sp. HUCO-GS316 TaxID=2692198 RepID=UPI00136A5E85|nr:cupin domain-containing protein [Streptomyces sp. HUCO-GS316]MXM66379.1 cupin domain-containing protein [Streptomyces sp. HUCO-GS316]
MASEGMTRIAAKDVESNRRRGGDLRTLLSPATAQATAGFMGVLTLQPGEVVTEHYHPYSEEFLYLISGELLAKIDGEPVPLAAGEALHLKINVRHRLENHGTEPAFMVFQLGPLAPRPELGHVDTEPLPGQESA